MKKYLILGLAICMLAATGVHAEDEGKDDADPFDNVIGPAQVREEAAPGSSAGLIVPLLLIAIIAAAASN